jgi:hypothetical protein
MKKLVLVFAVVLIGLVSVQAAGLTAPTIYGPSYWDCVYAATLAHADDSLSDYDTIVFSGLTKKRIEPGYEYEVKAYVTTAASDSIRFDMVAYGADGSTAFSTTEVDTMSASTTNKSFVLPLGKTVISNCVTVKAVGLVDSKVRIFSRLELWRRCLAQAKEVLQ